MCSGKSQTKPIIKNGPEAISSTTDKTKLISVNFVYNIMLNSKFHLLPDSPPLTEHKLSDIYIMAWKVATHQKR